jgi:hypothetical protein
MYLVYVNSLNTNFRGEHLFEFLFSKSTDIELPENWESSSFNDKPEPPDPGDISFVGLLRIEEEENTLYLCQYNKSFEMIDAIDGVIPLAFEDRDEEERKENRLVFHYGMHKDKVEDILYKRDFHLEAID